jgi:dihydrolipoamide dehydrogenase
MAGDVAGGIANPQRAAAQGRIAGFNAVHRRKRRWRTQTPMAIVFSEPNIAAVGMPWCGFDERHMAVAQQRFGPVGRALSMGQNRGLPRVYAARRSGRILGASMLGSRREHLTHLIAWAIEQEMTVERALAMPFYHPVIEEALQDALLELNAELSKARASWASGWLNPARTLIRSAAPS